MTLWEVRGNKASALMSLTGRGASGTPRDRDAALNRVTGLHEEHGTEGDWRRPCYNVRPSDSHLLILFRRPVDATHITHKVTSAWEYTIIRSTLVRLQLLLTASH
ncbi:unnamed protein product [Chrysodeixis includens]|uniref:Uncharacterized protein n=1 Tax=Chrysodeixis includens TaxID=689277 RepID=A0A9P0BXM9_CHRIL|nr:unnamed protein product [Chrysodeixis includens]